MTFYGNDYLCQKNQADAKGPYCVKGYLPASQNHRPSSKKQRGDAVHERVHELVKTIIRDTLHSNTYHDI